MPPRVCDSSGTYTRLGGGGGRAGWEIRGSQQRAAHGFLKENTHHKKLQGTGVIHLLEVLMSVKYPGEKSEPHLKQSFSPRHAASAAGSVALPGADQSRAPLAPPAHLHQAQGIISKYLHQL